MTVETSKIASIAAADRVWTAIRNEAAEIVTAEPLMASFVHQVVLRHETLESSLSFRLAQKLGGVELPEMVIREIFEEAFAASPEIGAAARADIVAVQERDPACRQFADVLLYLKGFQGLISQRVAHWLWRVSRRDLSRLIQMRMSEVFTIDIHPGAQIGKGVMIDHAHGIVIGETSVVGDDVSMLHSVTLGGTGKEHGDRHPKIGTGVLIGAGAKILGNITIGDHSRIAAGSVVLQDVPRCKTVAGVPARVVGDAGCFNPAQKMDQLI